MVIDKNIISSVQLHRNLAIKDLISRSLAKKETEPSKTGAVIVYTGRYTGRSPNDRFIVDTKAIHNNIDWGAINKPISSQTYDNLYKKVTAYLSSKEELFVFDGYAGADENYKLQVRIISEYAYQALFTTHLLRRPTGEELKKHEPQLTILSAPGLKADPKADGTNSEVFIILNLEKMIILIGGTKYSGEIKKSVFTVMNYLLPQKGVFPMHCSANMGRDGKTALFFGLSGTGKTTLSADTDRFLIGDDEHGWSENGIFNFEGGCYAKCIDLKRENEPQIWDAIRAGTLLENVVVKSDGELDFSDKSLTENTRAAYPIDYIENAVISGMGKHPNYILFLTADAFGVLPPVAKLNPQQAMYHFLSGYTSKLAGTERGINEPKAVFSTCFGAPFMPMKPLVYAQLLERYMTQYKAQVYLVNTGWSGGPYGVGKRISIKDTRAIVRAVLSGVVDNGKFRHDSLFNLEVPISIPEVDETILNPRELWTDKATYDKKARELISRFVENFKKFEQIPDMVAKEGPQL